MGFVKEFEEFAIKGNVVDLAVGVIIGGAFGRIVTSTVQDIIMPPIGIITGGIDFKDLKIILKRAAVDASGKAIPPVSINYGNFINVVIEFVIVALCIFILIKAINQLRREPQPAAGTPAAPEPTPQEKLLIEIRDVLKSRQ